ncbi:hypothetical protein evm_002593 [Chilo suppressalis]|nr:hypothetical protein evm_002593 [Chilo suppressalis]
MRYFLLLSLVLCIISRTVTRPSRLDQEIEREAEEVEYENNEVSPGEDDSLQEDEEATLNDEEARDAELGQDEEPLRSDGGEPARGERMNHLDKEKDMPHALTDERAENRNNEPLLEYNQREKDENVDEGASSNNDPVVQKRIQSNRYIERSYTSNVPENTQHLTIARNRIHDDVRDSELYERIIDSRGAPLHDSAILYDNRRTHKNNGDNSEYHKDVADTNEPTRHFKQFSNTMESDYKNIINDRNYKMAKFIINRERRQAEPNSTLILSSTSTEKSLAETANEDDETAIKRHIKKLSGEELEELLNSLSEEKKALLNKIMDNSQNNDTPNKREITKKAGAVEENNYMESGLSELSKLQGGSSPVDMNTESAIAQNSETENTKQEVQTESSDISNKIPETAKGETSENKVKLTDEAQNTEAISNSNEEDSKHLISDSQSAKLESKRQANIDYFKNEDESFDDAQLTDNYMNLQDLGEPFEGQGYACASHEGDVSQLLDDDAHKHANQEFKREVLLDQQAALDDSIKSLEESFPKSNCEESGQYLESNMAPLIRVKRKEKNLDIQKRAAGVLSDSKVAYVPYKAENEDVDNDEGSEFDDDGFYDRTANYVRNNINRANADAALTKAAFEPLKEKSKQLVLNKEKLKLSKSSLNKLSADTNSLGSDTDSVLSGIEGVDDNLMYSSGNRNKRTLQENLEMKEMSRNLRSTPVGDDIIKTSDTHINIPHYQENDAFGALPRSYEGDLGRYKRIRRVKSSSEVTCDE